jgi:hypothetical protein
MTKHKASKKRKASSEPRKRRPTNKKPKLEGQSVEYSIVKLRLSTIVTKDEELRSSILELLDRCADNLSKIVHEAYFLANVHVLRCLTGENELPVLSHSFFYACCSSVTNTTRLPNDDVEFRASLDAYKQLRPSEFEVPFNEYMSRMIGDVSRQMETNTKNHIVLNAPKRLLRYIQLHYGLKAREAQRFMYDAFNQQELTREQTEFKNNIKYNPYFKDEVKRNLSHFIQELWKILKEFEKPEHKGKKGVRKFTLLPMKADFITSFMPLSESYLPEILKLLDEDKQRYIMNKLLEKKQAYAKETVDYLDSRQRPGCRSIFGSDLHQYKDLSRKLWELLFPGVFKLETMNRKFGFRLSTNGYAVSVSMEKPAMVVTEPRLTDEEEEEEFEKDFDPTPASFEGFTSFIGIDPGRTYIATACDDQDKRTKVSTREYRHKAKMIEQKKWEKRFRKNNREYSELIKNPSLKTANFATYCANLKIILTRFHSLYEISRRPAFRAWRFKTFVFGKKALHELARKIVGKGKKKEEVCIGFGDWSQQDRFLKGTEKAPVKKFRSVLRTMATVIKIDEYRTSKTCSECYLKPYSKVKNVRHLKVQKDGKTKSVKCHEVLRCKNNECKIYWQRDRNASRNIYTLLKYIKEGSERPASMRRKGSLRVGAPSTSSLACS